MEFTKIPTNSGCYIFKDKDNTIIYVGKAKNLQKRVSSYFLKKDHDIKTQALVKNIRNVEFFITSNELEALILENNLIKKYKPKYNIDLKDSQRYAYILITDEKYPRLLTARDKKIKGKYFGPFVSGDDRNHILKVLRDKFQIRTCRNLPKKACLRYHINLCSAPCINLISQSDYNASITKIEYFLKGNSKELIIQLEQEMKESSQKLLFEQAKIIRDQILALESLSEKQKLEKEKKYDEDIINYVVDANKVYLIVFNINKGILTTKNEFSFDYSQNILDEFILRYYSSHNIPKIIIVPHELDDSSIINYLSNLANQKVEIIVPKKGEKLQLLDLVKTNIELSFLKENKMILLLKDELNFNFYPRVIECFDISNTQGNLSVGSMVQFKDAKPKKTNYRRFKIKTVEGSDDFASIKEVVYRRYYNLKVNNLEYPDLIVIDGGKGQLSAAISALRQLEIKIPIISLAKKFEEINMPGLKNPKILKPNSQGLKLLQQIRDEAHRFAINYHRLLRSKKMIED